MAFEIQPFRVNFPEFNSAEKYPTPTIEFWAGLGELLVRSSIWGNAWNQGMSLYVAHQLVLAQQNQQAASLGGTPGQQGGIANNKTVGSATIGYDATTATEKDAGFWNLTNYGKQFIRLARIFGTRPIQL